MTKVGVLSLSLVVTFAGSTIASPSYGQDDDDSGSIVVHPILVAPQPYSGSDAVDLEVQTDAELGAYLMQSAPAGGSAGWAELCLLPCRLRVDPRRQYKIGGIDVSESTTFELRSGEHESLYVHPTAAGTSALGWIFFGLGATMTTVATILIAGAPSAPADSDTSAEATNARDSRMGRFLSGGIVLGVGVPFLVIGAAVLFGSSSTTVTNGEDGARIGATRLRIADGAWLTPSGVIF